MKKTIFISIISIFFFQGNSLLSQNIRLHIIQLNDIYEIGTLNGGNSGGVSRLATIEKELIKSGETTLTVLAGDFLSPSSMGVTKVNGVPLAGKQMVDVLNRSGLDLTTFGNHEFDLNETDLLSRINESRFEWIISNIDYWPLNDSTRKRPFSRMENGREVPFSAFTIKEYYGANASVFRIGFIGNCLTDNDPAFMKINDPIAGVKNTYEAIKNSCDIVIAVTHQTIEADKVLAQTVPGLFLIIGGHEHVNSFNKIGNVPITKADANLRTIYHHVIEWNPGTKKASIKSTLEKVDQNIQEDPMVKSAVDYWTNLAFTAMKADGLDPAKVILVTKDTLDGRESSNRMHATNLGTMTSEAMAQAWPGAQFALLNSGSIRVDEQLTGTITEYDVTRILPFGGEISKVTMNGDLLIQVLDIGTSNKLFGNGGFLQTWNVTKGKKGWMIGKDLIKEKKQYIFAAPKYFITREKAYVDLWNNNKEKFTIEAATTTDQKDIRKALITYFSKQGK